MEEVEGGGAAEDVGAAVCVLHFSTRALKFVFQNKIALREGRGGEVTLVVLKYFG